jgi:hypothetical protein
VSEVLGCRVDGDGRKPYAVKAAGTVWGFLDML